MAKVNLELKSELQRILRNSGDRRLTLLGRAISRSKMKKRLTIYSGILALFSATAITTVLIKWVGNEGLQIVAAATAAVSGIMSLLITLYPDEETQKMFTGSSAYLMLRDKINSTLLNPNLTAEDSFDFIQKYQTEYATLDHLYAQYFLSANLSNNSLNQFEPFEEPQRGLSLFGRIMIAILPQTKESRVPGIFLQSKRKQQK